VGQRQAVPALGLREAPQGQAGIADRDRDLGVIVLSRSAGVLDQPIEVVAGASRLEIGSGLRCVSGRAEGLAQAEEGVAVVRVRREGRSKMAHGGDIAPAQRQPAAEALERRMTGGTLRQQAIGDLHRSAVDRPPGASRTSERIFVT
jgi:hypothetical protein